jgi:hypothetical protein
MELQVEVKDQKKKIADLEEQVRPQMCICECVT